MLLPKNQKPIKSRSDNFLQGDTKYSIIKVQKKRSVIFMMTAKINFITNNLLVDMTCRENELRNSLQNIGIQIVPSMIYLDNRRTLQIQLNANDEVGEIVKTLINTERDTLGTVQRLCRRVYNTFSYVSTGACV